MVDADDVNEDGRLDITIFGKLSEETELYQNCLVPYLRKEGPEVLFEAGKRLNLTTSSEPTFFAYSSGSEKTMISGLLYYSSLSNNRKYAVYEHGVLNS